MSVLVDKIFKVFIADEQSQILIKTAAKLKSYFVRKKCTDFRRGLLLLKNACKNFEDHAHFLYLSMPSKICKGVGFT